MLATAATPRFVGVAGLPRAGSTLLCQLLALHPDIHCEGHSSPLTNVLLDVRRFVSDDTFFLSQLDVQFDTTYAHLKSAMKGFLHGWYEGAGKPLVVDKNRAWLHHIEFLLELEPDARLLVPVRDLVQIYGSIEARHQQTILVDFIDHLADFSRFGRADQLFAKDKIIGAPLSSINAVLDLPQALKDRLFFLRFEDLMARPEETMGRVFDWLGLPRCALPLHNLPVAPHESDSHYHGKYSHARHAAIRPPVRHEVPERISRQIRDMCGWYYDWLYPDAR
ncbi:MAG: sulfotransferase [Pseudomonadota bacterium]|nr:sulfotransferase [Pseudomonadota bacterium]MDP1572662.1 sulfotransferase [Pseudomonadota bacterium]MDP1906535.1 sulfotransferase [Pseudomonadota bacterium]